MHIVGFRKPNKPGIQANQTLPTNFEPRGQK